MAKKLLVADDSLTIQKVIKLALSGDGYEIQTVSDGTECLQQAALFRPDVILIDVGLPGRSAFDIKKAANDDPDLSQIPVVLMSSAFEKVDEAKVALLKFDGRLTKPFDPSNLKEVLNQALKMKSGEGVRGFAPPPPPSAGEFSLEPSEQSKKISLSRPPTAPGEIDNDVTGEIRIADPAPKTFELNEHPSAAPSTNADDSDIRHLTESTVKMSGLDDLGGWNIAESAKTSLPPIPEIFSGDSPNGAGIESSSDSSSDLAPMAPTHGLDLELHAPAFGNTGQVATPPKPPSPGTGTFDFESPSPVSTPSGETLEALVEKHVRNQLEQMAKKALPDIAERVVKAEIRKLLEGLAKSE